MLRSVLPVINYIFTCNNNMSLIHGHVFWFDCDILILDWAANSVTKCDDPLIRYLFDFCNKNAILSTCDNFLKSSHVLNMFFINHSVPENDAHIISLRFLKSEDKSVVEIRPKIFWLNISKEDVRIYCQTNSKAETFPTKRIDYS